MPQFKRTTIGYYQCFEAENVILAVCMGCADKKEHTQKPLAKCARGLVYALWAWELPSLHHP